MAEFITPNTEMPAFLMFPRFLLDADISETEKLTYLVLLDRARLSQKNEGWTDENGHVFIVFPIEDLEQVLHKGERTIRRSLDTLANTRRILQSFDSLLIEEDTIEISEEVINRWIDALTKINSPKTVSDKVSYLRKFLRYLQSSLSSS